MPLLRAHKRGKRQWLFRKGNSKYATVGARDPRKRRERRRKWAATQKAAAHKPSWVCPFRKCKWRKKIMQGAWFHLPFHIWASLPTTLVLVAVGYKMLRSGFRSDLIVQLVVCRPRQWQWQSALRALRKRWRRTGGSCAWFWEVGLRGESWRPAAPTEGERGDVQAYLAARSRCLGLRCLNEI